MAKRLTKYQLRKQAAPLLDLMLEDEQVDDLQRLIVEQSDDFRAALATRKHPDGIDGKYGPKLEEVIKQIAKEAGISEKDIPKIDFFNDADPLFKSWKDKLEKHHKPEETIEQSSQRVVAAAPSGPTDAERAAAAERMRALAEKAAADRAADAKVPAAIRGTEYDPRNLPKGDKANDERYALAVKGLFALDELKSERSTPSLENIHDKMKETVRKVNKALGTNYPIPTESDPLSDSALEALGLRVAMAGGIRGAEETVYQKATGKTQQQLDAAAAIGLHALDRTSGITRDSEILRREIRQFEREVMGLSKVEAAGVADDAMIKALEDAVRMRGGLAKVTGGQAVVAAAVASQPPAPTPVKAPTESQGLPR